MTIVSLHAAKNLLQASTGIIVLEIIYVNLDETMVLLLKLSDHLFLETSQFSANASSPQIIKSEPKIKQEMLQENVNPTTIRYVMFLVCLTPFFALAGRKLNPEMASRLGWSKQVLSAMGRK